MGAALVAMVAELTIARPDAAPHAQSLRQLRDDAVAHHELLQRLAEQDAAAYQAVVAARRLPKETDEERAARSAELGRAMIAAAEVPLRTAEVAAEVLDLAHQVAPIGNPNAVSDAGVGAQLAGASVRGAILNVRINLPYLPAESPLRETAAAEADRLERHAADVEAATLAIVNGRIMPS
jgi:formiminotetrahydrofolate cyclodeaminase